MAQSQLPFTGTNTLEFQQNLLTTIPKELDNKIFSKELNSFINFVLLI